MSYVEYDVSQIDSSYSSPDWWMSPEMLRITTLEWHDLATSSANKHVIRSWDILGEERWKTKSWPADFNIMKNEPIWDSHPFFGGKWNNISRNKPRTGGSTSNTLTGQETCAKSCCKCFSLSSTGICNVLSVFGTKESANIFGKQLIFLGVSF